MNVLLIFRLQNLVDIRHFDDITDAIMGAACKRRMSTIEEFMLS